MAVQLTAPGHARGFAWAQTADPEAAAPAGLRRRRPADDLVAQLAREHSVGAPLAGLRELADRYAFADLGLLFPHYAARGAERRGELSAELDALDGLLAQALAASRLGSGLAVVPDAVIGRVHGRLGAIRDALLEDARAMYDGDPAAVSVDEVILAYPGFLAIATYRMAHELHGQLPLFARLLTEVAHRATGIDIHPGARIGASFAIDHGTGVVIGETAVLGERVRLYQGVTLGAARVTKGLQRTKRHPTIGDDVTIYANATILGGETIVGRGSRIGGNVWLTRSVPPYSVVTPTARVERRQAESGAPDDLIELSI